MSKQEIQTFEDALTTSWLQAGGLVQRQATIKG